jgi:mRNA interferase MazF
MILHPKRGMVLDINLEPTLGSETGKIRPCIVVTNEIYNNRSPVIQVVPVTAWNEKKHRILTNISLPPSPQNGLDKLSIADCLQTRPIDYKQRSVRVRGYIETSIMQQIDVALTIVFGIR